MRLIQRMEVDSGWSISFLFQTGTPALPVALSDWMFDGKAWISELPSSYLNLTTLEVILPDDTVVPPRLTVQDYVIRETDISINPNLVVGQQVQLLVITLDEDDTAYLGDGVVEFEVRRVEPLPVRPIIKFKTVNHPGP